MDILTREHWYWQFLWLTTRKLAAAQVTEFMTKKYVASDAFYTNKKTVGLFNPVYIARQDKQIEYTSTCIKIIKHISLHLIYKLSKSVTTAINVQLLVTASFSIGKINLTTILLLFYGTHFTYWQFSCIFYHTCWFHLGFYCAVLPTLVTSEHASSVLRPKSQVIYTYQVSVGISISVSRPKRTTAQLTNSTYWHLEPDKSQTHYEQPLATLQDIITRKGRYNIELKYNGNKIYIWHKAELDAVSRRHLS